VVLAKRLAALGTRMNTPQKPLETGASSDAHYMLLAWQSLVVAYPDLLIFINTSKNPLS